MNKKENTNWDSLKEDIGCVFKYLLYTLPLQKIANKNRVQGIEFVKNC